MISLIVGLGNPGAEYAQTRHNAGAWFIEELCARYHGTLHLNAKFHGLHGTIRIDNIDCHLLIPTTFMNLSGQAVHALAGYFKVAPQNILIAHDEIDLPFGEIRLKLEGGHGGHNGLRDIIRHLSTNKFHRLRIGVGHPGQSHLVHDYVLHAPKKIERDQIDAAISDAIRITPLLVNGEIQKAMQDLHTKER